jgi:hypothetical protein
MRLRLAAVMVAAMMTMTFGPVIECATARVKPATADGPTASGDSAKVCFDRARKLGFPAAGQNTPYVLRAEFKTRGSSGVVETGTYIDTWLNDKKWRREAVLGNSRFVRSRNGKKLYRLDEGPDAALLQFVLTAMEPIPSTDSFKDSDWKIKPDTIDGVATIRVARGRENPDGTPNPKSFEGYWFDDTGQLLKTYLSALQTRRSDFEDFNGVQVARKVEVLLNGKVGMKIDMTELGPAAAVDSRIFTIKGHGWMRQYTSEVR